MELPILAAESEIVKTVVQNPVTIVVGETGSGKTTQLPMFLYQAGFGHLGQIGVTEPRRIAATSVARFVAQQLGTRLGDLVGYQIRFDSQAEANTVIKFMTDGILLREFQVDPDLKKYSVVMVDEAHERSENIDFTLGLLKNLLKRRQDLKVVIASATIDAEKFSRYFSGAPIVQVSGRSYPVEVVYLPQNLDILWTIRPMVEAVIKQVVDIHQSGKPGDVLVFMTGKDDINQVIDGLEKYDFADLVALPAYGGLVQEEQDQIFLSHPGKRKVVVATNVAETSITIDGIVYVVDSGLIKQTNFHPESGVQALDLVPHSKAGCDQRRGRAGRTQPGVCYRMYTEENFQKRPEYTEPEIRRTSIAGVVLTMESIGIPEIEKFEFIDSPNREAFQEAYETLIALGAIGENRQGLTEIGKRMALLPLDPRIARMVLEAEKHGCVQQVAAIAAFISVSRIFSRPKGKEFEAEEAHRRFQNGRSDVLTLLEIWNQYAETRFSNSWCYQHFLNARSLAEVANVRHQLFNVLEESGIPLSETDNEELVIKCVASGLIYNLFERASRFAYSGIFRKYCESSVFIHPGSSLFGKGMPHWIVATELVRTTKMYARMCTAVPVEWLPELAPQTFLVGLPMLVSWLRGSDTVEAKQAIWFRGRSIGTRELKIPIAEAREIEETAIRTAKERGWIKLTFTQDLGLRQYRAQEFNYVTQMFSDVEKFGTYYCEVAAYSYGLNRNDRCVIPKFRVLGLGDESAVPPPSVSA